MSLTATPDRGFRLTGWHVLAIIVSFFALVIAVDVTFAMTAVKTFPGEVSSTPYEDGLAYDRSYAQLQAQEKLGWRATAVAEPGVVVVAIRDRAGKPLTGLTVTGELERPATETGRIKLAFRETDRGRYVAKVAGLAGAWDFTAHAVDPHGVAFSADRRLTWS